MFAYTSGSTGADYLTEIDIGIWEQQLDDTAWATVGARPSATSPRLACAAGGSISACHGSCREGEVDLVPDELGRGFDVMLDIKRTLDPNNIMNPGKYLLDRAYPDAGQQVSSMNAGNGSGGPAYPYRYAEQYTPPEPQRVSDVAVTTFEHVYEVDPRLMQRWVLQQTFPNWDSLRIMNCSARSPGLDAPALRRPGGQRFRACWPSSRRAATPSHHPRPETD